MRRDSESFIARDESLLISPPDSYQLSGGSESRMALHLLGSQRIQELSGA